MMRCRPGIVTSSVSAAVPGLQRTAPHQAAPRAALRPGHTWRRGSREVRDLRPLAARLAADRRARQLARALLHDEGVRERVPPPDDVGGGRLVVIVAHVVADEMAGDAEMDVAGEEQGVLTVDTGDPRIEIVH